MYFESCYPIDSNLFLKIRFLDNLKSLKPTEVKQKIVGSDYKISSLSVMLEEIKDSVIYYNFEIKENVLMEILSIGDGENLSGVTYEVVSHLQNDKSESLFFSEILKTFGIVLFGKFDSSINEEEVFCRDAVCTYLQSILTSNKYRITWTESRPHINHFFMTNDFKETTLAVGGKFFNKEKVYFYIMKTLNRWGKDCIIKEEDLKDFYVITQEESEMINILINSIEKVNPNSEIYPVAKPLNILQKVFGENYYKEGIYFVSVDYNEPDTSTYGGIHVSEVNTDKKVIINTGNFKNDLQTVCNSFDDSKTIVQFSSSIDHFEMDMDSITAT